MQKLKGLKTAGRTESRIQQEIIKYYRNGFCLKHHSPRHIIASVPNEGKNYLEQSVKIQTGLFAGFSDLILIREKVVTFIEVKTPEGEQSQKQKEFESAVTALGFEYIIVRSLEDFKNKI
jgi:hypothetical protein